MTTNRCSEKFTLADGTEVQCNRKAAPKREVNGHEAVCLKCFDAWGMENSHYDGMHEAGPVDGCPECGTYDPRGRKGHTNTAPKSHGSHRECYAAGKHLPTPKDRAACRKAHKDLP